MSLTCPPRGCNLTSWYTPGVPVGPEFYGDPAGDSLSQHHNGGSTVLVPFDGSFHDVPAAGSSQILIPSQFSPTT